MSNTAQVLFLIGFAISVFVSMHLSFHQQEETSVLDRWAMLVGPCLCGISFIIDREMPYTYFGGFFVFLGIIFFTCS